MRFSTNHSAVFPPVHQTTESEFRQTTVWATVVDPSPASALIAYLSWKIEIGRDWYRSQIGRDWRGKSENVYSSGTRTFWFFRDQSNIKSVYRSTHFHFCPVILVQFGFCTNLVRFRFSSFKISYLIVERTAPPLPFLPNLLVPRFQQQQQHWFEAEACYSLWWAGSLSDQQQ